MAETRIQAGRGAVYSLFGTGFYGLNGLKPNMAIKVWKVYIVPRLHGLEVTKSHPSKIEKISKDLKQLPHLPPLASNSATDLLSVVLLIVAEIENWKLATAEYMYNTVKCKQ